MSRRREQVLNAAIEVLGTGGARRLTYQAVDAAAEVPAGTTSNYFRNRAALLDGVVRQIEALDRLDWEAFSAAVRPASLDELVEAMATFVRQATGPGRARTTARYLLFLEASANPELREPLARSRAAIVDWGAPWLRLLGSPTPERHCVVLLDYLDGLVLHYIAMPGPAIDPEGIRGVVAGLVGMA
ncbi:TetR family transcriptional regulator [Solihabitans fulvus]|uniref:TetR family transcriptional regulator n=1 Tax=Solihabitans fulvus TaxID=1892852 RepID=A0A5B2WYE8_9PSEU|nr:TetR family transcriptional regulator [Solihabitans fulvus]KAA2255944.1 TetR family transcriptional regulator [Solihabitans fulvus]